MPGPRYFQLEDRTHGVEIEGWFDAVKRYPGLAMVWKQALEDMNANRSPLPSNVEFTKLDRFDVIEYRVAEEGRVTHHARMELLEDQTWIDLDVTSAGEESAGEIRERLMSVLRTITVKRD